MSTEMRLDLGGRHVFAAHFQDVFDAPNENQCAVGVQRSAISGRDPPLRIDGGRGCVLILVIPAECVDAAKLNLAGGSRTHGITSGWINDADFNTRYRIAIRIKSLVGR